MLLETDPWLCAWTISVVPVFCARFGLGAKKQTTIYIPSSSMLFRKIFMKSVCLKEDEKCSGYLNIGYCRLTDKSGVALCFSSSTGSFIVTSQEVT